MEKESRGSRCHDHILKRHIEAGVFPSRGRVETGVGLRPSLCLVLLASRRGGIRADPVAGAVGSCHSLNSRPWLPVLGRVTPFLALVFSVEGEEPGVWRQPAVPRGAAWGRLPGGGGLPRHLGRHGGPACAAAAEVSGLKQNRGGEGCSLELEKSVRMNQVNLDTSGRDHRALWWWLPRHQPRMTSGCRSALLMQPRDQPEECSPEPGLSVWFYASKPGVQKHQRWGLGEFRETGHRCGLCEGCVGPRLCLSAGNLLVVAGSSVRGSLQGAPCPRQRPWWNGLQGEEEVGLRICPPARSLKLVWGSLPVEEVGRTRAVTWGCWREWR